MKKKLLVFITLLMLSIAAFAYTRNTSPTSVAAACCCCKGDSCPMKKDKDASKDKSSDKASCCDKCKGDSCPMHKGDAAHDGAGAGEHAGDCSCACCKDKAKDGAA